MTSVGSARTCDGEGGILDIQRELSQGRLESSSIGDTVADSDSGSVGPSVLVDSFNAGSSVVVADSDSDSNEVSAQDVKLSITISKEDDPATLPFRLSDSGEDFWRALGARVIGEKSNGLNDVQLNEESDSMACDDCGGT